MAPPRSGPNPPPIVAIIVWPAVLKRALLVALGVGLLVNAGNQLARLGGGLDVNWLQIGLTFLTPFAVVAFSQAVGIRQGMADARLGPLAETYFRTMGGHGIPRRAVLIAVVTGAILTGVVLVMTAASGARAGDIGAGTLAQFFVLPLTFGFVSQGIAYRGARARAGQRIAPPRKETAIGISETPLEEVR